ncbi:MAG: hypothetical protein N3F09_02365 [Bacteroidia bacterium]|nr:hypothetical protein [Bacteroidia bacterium]
MNRTHMARSCITIVIGILLWSCKTQHAYISDSLVTEGETFDIKNRQALHWFKDMELGTEYTAKKIKRSWTEGYHFPFILRFSGMKEKFSFVLNSNDSVNQPFKAAVFCLNKIKEKQLPDFIPYPFPLKYENIFSGKIILLSDTSVKASFLINEPPYIMTKEHISEGKFFFKNEVYEIKGVNAYRKKNGSPGFTGQIIGFEVFDKNNKPIMGVSCMNVGKVWYVKNLDKETKNFLMALSAAMLLKRELKDDHERLKTGHAY